MKKIPVFAMTIFICFLVSLPITAIAQRRPLAFTISPLAGVYLTEGNQDFDSGQLYGLGIGFNFTEHWSLEIMGKYRNFEQSDGSPRAVPFEQNTHGYILQLDALYHIMPYKRLVPYLALGGGGLKYDNDKIEKEEDETTGFFNYGAGMEYFFTEHIAFRADARHIVTFEDENHHNNVSLSVGLTFLLGGKGRREQPPQVITKDSDGDGVTDDIDQCPDTPKGAKVDLYGCPLDSDNDGVYDYMDKCPETPKGVQVDDKGCPLDSDNDGVYDYMDECPETPKGIIVDSKGCPRDTDGDGVPDSKDKCPNTPQGMQVDTEGCPLDADNDGVPDGKDKCPNTPKGVQVDTEGCPLDADNDGVADYKDKCPNTPKNVQVDTEGCPLDSDNDGVADYKDKCPNTPKAAVADENGCWTIGSVLFDIDKWDIRPEGKTELNKIVNILKKDPDIKLEIQGHTDNTGSKAHNDILSKKRADSVMKYLIDHGITSERLKAKGYGFSMPVDTNTTYEGRQRNRRVQFEPIYQ